MTGEPGMHDTELRVSSRRSITEQGEFCVWFGQSLAGSALRSTLYHLDRFYRILRLPGVEAADQGRGFEAHLL